MAQRADGHGRGERRTLERLLSRLGVGSRTQAAELVRAGRVRVAGRLVRDPSAWVDADAEVHLDGRPVTRAAPLHLALNKPKGFVTTLRDPEGNRTVYDLLTHVDRWVGPIGRLDKDTSGLLLFTNDTRLAERLANPASKVEKVYRARVVPALDDEALERLRGGVELDDGPTAPARVRSLGRWTSYGLVEIAISEGRNRQVRRMVRAVGAKVRELRRTAIGPVELGDLASGATRELTSAELRGL
jgi:pseudouridine synthase